MSGFIATNGIAPASEPYPITNDGWFPDLDGAHVRAALRLDASISDARLETALANALIEVNQELRDYKSARQAEGHADLAAVPAEAVQGESQLLHLYRRAVYCSAGAELAERYRSYDSTDKGHANADELTPSIDEYRRDARWAISRLLGRGHTTVELI